LIQMHDPVDGKTEARPASAAMAERYQAVCDMKSGSVLHIRLMRTVCPDFILIGRAQRHRSSSRHLWCDVILAHVLQVEMAEQEKVKGCALSLDLPTRPTGSRVGFDSSGSEGCGGQCRGLIRPHETYRHHCSGATGERCESLAGIRVRWTGVGEEQWPAS